MLLWLPLLYPSYGPCGSVAHLKWTGTVISTIRHSSAGRQVLLAGGVQSKAEDSGAFDGNSVQVVPQLPPVSRYPLHHCSPGSVSICPRCAAVGAFQWTGPGQGICLCDHAPRLNPPQIKSQKKLWCFPELRICPSSINVALPPSRALFRRDTEQHLMKANVSGVCTAPQIPQKWSFRKNHLDATKWAINVEIS